MLFWQALIHRNEHIKVSCHGIKQRSVVQVRPTHLGYSVNLVSCQLLTQPLWNAGIKDDSHTVTLLSLSRYGLRKKGSLREFENRDSVFTGNTREIFQKVRQGVPSLKIVDKSLGRGPESLQIREFRPIGRETS